MAAGALVPFEVSPGRTVMVPDYLVPQPAAAPLQLPEAGAPPPPDPNRLASAPKNSILGVDLDDPWGKKRTRDTSRLEPDWQPGNPNLSVYSGGQFSPRGLMEEREAKTENKPREPEPPSNADPGDLVPFSIDPRRPSGSTQDTATALYGGRKTGGANRPADPNNLNLVAAEIKQERTPGVQMLPEQMWRYGFSERPEFPDEIDPDAVQPTWGNEDPVRRPYLTPIERGAKQAGEAAYKAGEQDLIARREMSVAQLSALAQQSEALDQHLSTIAERRTRIAALQDAADARMTEADSFEPRTRNQVWDSRGGALARIMAIIGIGLGGAAQGRTGGSNAVWDMINQSIDDEVNDDRSKWERKRQLGLDAKTDLSRAMQAYGDLDMAMLETKNRKLASSLAYIKQMQGDRGLDMNGQAYLAQLRAQGEEAFLENRRLWFDMAVGKVTKEEATLKPYGQVLQSATPKPTGGGGAAAGRGAGAAYGMSPEEFRKFTKEERSMAVKLPAGITMPGGRDDGVAFVRDPNVRQETQQRLTSLNRMRSNLTQIQKWRTDGGKTLPLTEARGKIQALAADFTLAVKSGEQLGALDKGSVEFMANLIGRPEEFTVLDATTDGKIKQQLRIVDSKVRAIMENELDNSTLEITAGGQSPEGLE